MPHTAELFLTILASVLASSGFWAILQRRMDNRDAKTQMIIGLGHDRIISLGMSYIHRGWITHDEYENLVDYLYKPYHMMGGNGSAERIVNEVKQLPVRSGASALINQNGSGGDVNG